jgi:hypothetical protein
MGKPERNRRRRRWVDNIMMDLGEVGLGDVDCIGLAQDKEHVDSSCEFGIKHSGFMKCWETI